MKIKRNAEPSYDMKEGYTRAVQTISSMDLTGLSDCSLAQEFGALKLSVQSGRRLCDVLVESFGIVKEAIKRTLGLTPFPTQIMAGLALFEGKIAQMQTGEGKTLAAVMPACLHALTGKGVHILTFNDYLAKRDTLWMGPVFNFLGLSVGYIQEGMTRVQRQKAYGCDITYVTSREAGFDYLRDFMSMDIGELVHRPLYYAIVDEADSIMIDEARIPLVIAGKYGDNAEDDLHRIMAVASSLVAGKHFEVDYHGKDIFLTDEGILYAEGLLGCGNLYDESNAFNLSSLYISLYVMHLVQRDRDYIVKNGKVLLIDEFTGRIAEKRMFPNRIQSALEIKEGIAHEGKGQILGSIAMQHYLSLYPVLAGMTGTATNASITAMEASGEGQGSIKGRKIPKAQTPCSEFASIYRKEVVAIPAYKPCIRVDHPDRVFTGYEEKMEAIIYEIERVHQTGQPILIGTRSVEDSENLAGRLKERGLDCVVLNAKNDEMEAAIIANAGCRGAITVSTNMAGRGVDIRLGGEDGVHHQEVAALGGLYVIGTERHESVRIDNQLRGRAGRQGDPGESRFFISLEDSLFQRFELTKGFMERFCPDGHRRELEDPHLYKEIARCQRMVEGYNGDMRSQLTRYTYVVEQQRRILFQQRLDLLCDRTRPDLLERHKPDRYSALCAEFGEGVVRKAEKQLTLYLMNKLWAEHLDYLEYTKESIHLAVLGGQSLMDVFNRKAIDAFDGMQEDMALEVLRLFDEVTLTPDGVDMEKEGLLGPASTWTFLLNESTDQFSRIPQMIKAVSKAFTGTLFNLRGLYRRLAARLKGKSQRG